MWDFDRSQPRMSQPWRNDTDNSSPSPPQEDGACVITGNVITQETFTQDDSNVNITQLVCPEIVTVVTRPEYFLHKNHNCISSILDEWHGLNAFSPQLNSTCHAGGIHQLEMKYKIAWRKNFSCGDQKRFSRHRSIITNVKFLIGRSCKSDGDVITFLDKKCDEDDIHTVSQTQMYMNKRKEELLAELTHTPTNPSTRTPSNATTTAPTAPIQGGFDPAPSNATPTAPNVPTPTQWGFDST